MAPPGPPPKSAALKLMQGGLAHKAKPKAKDSSDSGPIVAPPKAPSHLDTIAKSEFKRIAWALAERRQWSDLFQNALEVYCTAYSTWRHARKMIKQDGYLKETPNGYNVQDAWLPIANKAAQEMQKLSTELGLTLLAQVRVQGETIAEPKKAEKPKDGWADV